MDLQFFILLMVAGAFGQVQLSPPNQIALVGGSSATTPDPDVQMTKWKEKDHIEIADALRKDIYAEYGKSIVDFKPAPVKEDQTLQVAFSFLPDRIGYIDLKRQRFSVNGFVIMVWNDSRISWDKATYKNVDQINIKPHKMWIPPMKTSSGYMFTSSNPSPRAAVTHKGQITYVASSTVGMDCPEMDYANFPHDVHFCNFGFWLDSFELGPKDSVKLREWKREEGSAVIVSMMPYLDLDNKHWTKTNSLTWEILESNVESIYKKKSGALYHSAIEYRVQFRRKTSSFGLVFILPIIISSFFLMLMFSFPLGSRNRYWIALGGFIALCQVYGQLYSFLPSSSDSVPKLVKFYGLILTVFFLGLIETALFDLILKRLETALCLPPPDCLQKLVELIGKLVCYRTTPVSMVRFENQPNENGTVENGTVTENGTHIEPTKQVGTKNPEWSDVIRVLDSFVFAIFFVVYLLGLIVLVIF